MSQDLVSQEDIKENGELGAPEDSLLIMHNNENGKSSPNSKSHHKDPTDEPKFEAIEMSLVNGQNHIDEKEKIVVLDGDDGAVNTEGTSPKVGILKMKRCDVRYLFIALMILIILIGIASIAILAHKFETKTYEDLKFSSHFSDNMVLQRFPHRSFVWGYVTLPSDDLVVEVKLQGQKVTEVYKAHVDRFVVGATWSVSLKEHNETTPFQLTAYVRKSDNNDHHMNDNNNNNDQLINGPPLDAHNYLYSVTLSDVLFGDVWVCAGDQFMEASYKYEYEAEPTDDGDKRIDDYDDYNAVNTKHNYGAQTNIRLLSLYPSKSDIPWNNLRNVKHQWTLPSQDSLSNTSATCWMFGEQLARHFKYPIGLISTTYPNSVIDEWAPQSFNKCSQGNELGVLDQSGRIFNAMLHPLFEVSTYGVVWFQGELDASKDSHNYSCSLLHLINSWREYENAKRHQPFDKPFAIVQVPPSSNTTNNSFSRVDIRWKQTINYGYLPNPALPGTYLVPTIDLMGEHLSYKKLSKRLLDGALVHAYHNDDGGASQPNHHQLPINYRIERYPHIHVMSVELKEEVLIKEFAGFEICCSKDSSSSCSSLFMKVPFAPGREWVEAPIIPPENGTMVAKVIELNVSHHCSHNVTGLRYLWREAPCKKSGGGGGASECPLHFVRGHLPLLPFIRFNFDSKSVLDPVYVL